MNRSTIAAICTPRGFGGVGIIKLSGSKSIKIVRSLFRSKVGRQAPHAKDPQNESSFKDKQLRYGVVIHPETGKRIDEVLISVMPAPKSYTGEDVVEINAHAGPVVLNAILEAVVKQGAQLAEPGEFTRRAFSNGRIDLTQAEAVIDLINARTASSAQIANSQMAGHMRMAIELIRENITGAIALNEAAIDFPEDIDEGEGWKETFARLKKSVVQPLEEILDRFDEGRIYRDGLKLAVVGRPNVGKSSLMNCLVKTDRAIVTDIPGTTRDVVEDFISIKGVPIVIVDTAGLQKTENPVEKIGIEKTLKNIEKADLILFVVEEGDGIQDDDQKIFRKIEDKSILIVINKTDLEQPGKRTLVPVEWGPHRHLRVSALHGEGLNDLEEAIYEFAGRGLCSGGQQDFAPNLRQKQLIEKCLEAARAAIESSERHDPGELTAIDLEACRTGLDQILGRHLKEDILERIFSQFCIGK